MMVNEKLEEFLIKAKRATYADVSSNNKTISSRIGSKDYEFMDNGMNYHDTYFGGVKFIGEEVVYNEENIPIWGMNYYGVTLDDDLSENIMDNALRPALSKVGEDKNVLPVRGPSNYLKDGYKYTFSCDGSIDGFTGTEEIYYERKLIYRLHVHGGLIK